MAAASHRDPERVPLALQAAQAPGDAQHEAGGAMPSSLFASWAAIVLGACGGGGGGGPGMEVVSCSLGCNHTGSQASCAVTDVAVNQEIRVFFSNPVDLDSVDNDSFQVVQLSTGTTPPSTFLLDPNDPRVLIYRPLLTFDSSGAPKFGFSDGETYVLTIPGERLDRGPFVRSRDGASNRTRVRCALVASQGLFDPRPGSPRVSVTVTTIDPASGALCPDQPARGATDVWRRSPITYFFDDLMNPTGLVDFASGRSDLLSVSLDPDGDLFDTSDQVPIRGSFAIVLDQNALTTTVTFTPADDYPSRGTNDLSPRRMAVSLPPGIVDLGGNPLSNGGLVSFVTEKIVFPFSSLFEGFDGGEREDELRSGSRWGGGALRPGTGGGTGALGDLSLPRGHVLVLDTDSEDFSGVQDREIFDPGGGLIGAEDPMTGGLVDPVMGGIFELTHLRIHPGAVLRFEGSRPPRIFVRGGAVIDGIVDVSGVSGIEHDSESPTGGLGAAPGPSGGAGGDGGHSPDGSAFVDLGGVPNPGITLYEDVDGKPGEGIPFPDTLQPTALVAAGQGAIAWPQPTPEHPDIAFPADPEDLEVLNLSFFTTPRCRIVTPASGGGGGGHALSGLDSSTVFYPFGHPPFFDLVPIPDEARGGQSSELMIDELVMTIDPDLGLLRGGAGGGGAGAHLYDLQTDGWVQDCTVNRSNRPTVMTQYLDHSGAGGGGGAGGVQMQVGRVLEINGQVDAGGGDGGSLGPGSMAMGGGGGGGGDVLLQAAAVLIRDFPARVDFAGGRGGLGIRESVGGDGGPGFLRIESGDPLPDRDQLARFVRPDGDTIVNELGVAIDDLFRVVPWTARDFGPSAGSGAQSCWLRLPGNYFQLQFQEDDPPDPGWDMKLLIDGFAEPQSFRGENDVFDMPLDVVLGNDLGSSPVVVRFQGARLLDSGVDLCNVRLHGEESEIQEGSLTSWVRHPTELNDPATGRSVNIVRFVVIWDASRPAFGSILGVDELVIDVQPD